MKGLSDRQLIAFELFNNNYTPVQVCERVGVTQATASSWYAKWLSYLRYDENEKVEIKTAPHHYWQTEQEIEESLNPTYTYQGLSREEKAIYNGLL